METGGDVYARLLPLIWFWAELTISKPAQKSGKSGEKWAKIRPHKDIKLDPMRINWNLHDISDPPTSE